MSSDELERELSERLTEGEMQEEDREVRERRLIPSKYEVRIQAEHDPIVEETQHYRKLAKELDDRYDKYLERTKQNKPNDDANNNSTDPNSPVENKSNNNHTQ
ncbi:hypothetical protein ACE3MZ_02740 [Paenibacillus sp. WLX1005]|uniref:hypothetical protein n=1 Tax=unclassified Paenibacillus TaxID=185978 RepID=UPI003983FB51